MKQILRSLAYGTFLVTGFVALNSCFDRPTYLPPHGHVYPQCDTACPYPDGYTSVPDGSSGLAAGASLLVIILLRPRPLERTPREP